MSIRLHVGALADAPYQLLESPDAFVGQGLLSADLSCSSSVHSSFPGWSAAPMILISLSLTCWTRMRTGYGVLVSAGWLTTRIGTLRACLPYSSSRRNSVS